ncbi:hypothetical protein DMN91_005932 [Ooceraea biroi]|uniref:Large ribosomal subunit protein mL54 n=1 Tax=Ooceraea biroi TaxID=2015173 RepID=A0A026VUE1_OOCBI|nr:39S ribosomal protein L54, mitochondrial [Ooceraea biroi]EZA47280.1 39S ribosomal protein L54, mitochondrial [Ooceraea biroi]RLU21559.1 hypothetical protein DMN91_005932 [Ooceraea biroi]
MNLSVIHWFSHFSKKSLIPIQYTIQTRGYAKPVKKMKRPPMMVIEKKLLPVETDPHKLVNYVCGTNISKEGGEDVEIKPDSEYPSWLWSIKTGKAATLDELDPDTKQYWRKVRLLGLRRNNKERLTRKF